MSTEVPSSSWKAMLEEKFTSPPQWLTYFNKNPLRAVDKLLKDRYYFGHLDPVEPKTLLIDWAGVLSDTGFIERLDQVLAEWIEQNWGIPSKSITWGQAWSRVGDVVAHVKRLDNAAAALRKHFEERNEFLGPMSTGPSRDPLGHYLLAVACYQRDRSLEPAWRELCKLDSPDTPFYHGAYGVNGIRRLPDISPAEVAQAVVDLVDSLACLAETLKKEAGATARLTDASHHISTEVLDILNKDPDVSEVGRQWLLETLGQANCPTDNSPSDDA